MATGSAFRSAWAPLDVMPITTGCAFPTVLCEPLEAIPTTTGGALDAPDCESPDNIPTTTGPLFPGMPRDSVEAIPITSGDTFPCSDAPPFICLAGTSKNLVYFWVPQITSTGIF